eukprot:gene10065-10940_t
MRTRRQLAADRERKFPILIPAKNDLTPFQKSGSSIEGLPTSIFRIIQTFLSETDYRGLMNCNLATFQPIKFETVRYSLLGPEFWGVSDLIPTHRQREFFLNLLNSVKDKSNQIALKMVSITSSIIENQGLFQGIRKLELIGKHVGVKKFDFRMFNNIYDVVLRGFSGIEYFTEGFEGVVNLEISSFNNLVSITNINTNKTLRRLSITACLRFTSLEQSVDGISHVEIKCPKFSRLRSFEGQTHLTIITKQKLSIHTLNTLTNSLETLQYVDLDTKFPKEFRNYSLFQSIPHLKLSVDDFEEEFQAFKRFFPLFEGENLDLFGFNLSLWSESSHLSAFQNLLSLHLEDCVGLIELPNLPSLRELNLCKCYLLNFIPTFFELRILHLEILDIVSISPIQPKLREVLIRRCPNLKDLAFAGNTTTIEFFQLGYCPCVEDISMLGYIKYLKIGYCKGIRSVVGLSGTNIESDKRTIILVRLTQLKDFSPLHDIHRLELVSMSHFNDKQRIFNIDHLVIKDCEISNSRNLVNIRQSFTIKDCAKFQKEERSDIPVVKFVPYEPPCSNVMRPHRFNDW